MKIREKLFTVARNHHLLTDWEHEFIARMYSGIDGTHESLHDEEIKDYLSDAQIQKIKQIYSKYKDKITQSDAYGDKDAAEESS